MSFTTDTEADIQKCLHCGYKECINCLGAKEIRSCRGKLAKKHEEWTDKIRQLARLGYTDRQIATRMGISPKTVLTLRHAAGIPSSRRDVYDKTKYKGGDVQRSMYRRTTN